jgi:mono/diheme cytochrome c family protein
VAAAGGLDAAAIFGESCAGCHGGDGSGGLGPPLLSARMLERFEDPADQVLVVTAGRGNMPAFGERLSAEEIEAVVEYTRTALGG